MPQENIPTIANYLRNGMLVLGPVLEEFLQLQTMIRTDYYGKPGQAFCTNPSEATELDPTSVHFYVIM